MITLITGATGFIGRWVTRQLAETNDNIRLLVRPTSNITVFDGLELQFAKGDLLDQPSLSRALDGVKNLYHIAGHIDFHPANAARVRQINFDGTLNLFKAALQAGVERVVYTASIFALGAASSPSLPTIESGEFNLPHLLDIPYLRAKRDAECAAQEFIAEGLPLIRLYPGLCLGPGDYNRSSSGAIDLWLKGELPAIIRGGGMCLMDVRDAAAAHIAAMHKGIPGERYLATGYNVTLTELFERLSQITGKASPIFKLPASLGIPAVKLSEKLGLFPGLDSAQARLMAHYWWYDSSRAMRELGITFRPFDETLRTAVTWLAENPI